MLAPVTGAAQNANKNIFATTTQDLGLADNWLIRANAATSDGEGALQSTTLR